MNFRHFGRKNNPIRMSSLPMLLTCPGFAVLRSLEDDDYSGQAAINGTAVGRAVELWHNGVGEEGAMQQCLGENPRMETDFVGEILHEYALDPRNGPAASLQVLPEYQEQEVNLRIRGKSGWFYLKGHVDQVREDAEGNLWIWDLKAGRMYGGSQMVDCYAPQQILYALGMSQLLGQDVGYGGIVRLRGYVGRTNLKLPVDERPVFFHAGWSRERCQMFADRMVMTLDDIRRGRVQIAPGSQCSFCPASGSINCVPQLEALSNG